MKATPTDRRSDDTISFPDESVSFAMALLTPGTHALVSLVAHTGGGCNIDTGLTDRHYV